jgi:hypothetical protein
MTRLIRLKDPGFNSANASIHYYFIAGLLQEKLSHIAGMPMVFRVAQDIQQSDEIVYFEIGFVEYYFLDISVVEQADASKIARDFLDPFRDFFTQNLGADVSEYLLGDVLHYELKFPDNQLVEEFFVLWAEIFRKNVQVMRELNIRTDRADVAYEDWVEPSYVIIQITSNIGFTFDDYYHSVAENFPAVGYGVHIEKIPNGICVNFKDPWDYEVLFINTLDDDVMREHYRQLGIESEEYLQRRKQNVVETATEMRKQRVQKRRKKKTAI